MGFAMKYSEVDCQEREDKYVKANPKKDPTRIHVPFSLSLLKLAKPQKERVPIFSKLAQPSSD
jgi:hypothetical protein